MTDKVTSLTSRNMHHGVGHTRLDVAFKIILAVLLGSLANTVIIRWLPIIFLNADQLT